MEKIETRAADTSQTTEVTFGREARERLFEGLTVAAKAVGCTLGPRGRCVLLQNRDGAPIVTKDGVTVAKSMRLRDPLMAMGADLVKEAASRTNDVAGDGTTTSTVLTHALVGTGLKLMAAGHDPTELRRGMERGLRDALVVLQDMSVAVDGLDGLRHVATISANGDAQIGSIVAEAMHRVGRDGIVTIEDAKGTVTDMVVVEGMQVERGYISPYFVTNSEKMHANYHDALVLVTDKKLTSLAEIVPLLESVSRTRSGLLIVAEDIEGEALHALVVNKAKNVLQVVGIRAPGYGRLKEQLLEDIAVLTGTRVASAQTGVSLEKLAVDDLGRCKKVVVDERNTIIVGGGKTACDVRKRIDELRSQLTDVTLEPADVAHLKTRIARLSSGVAVVRVGGATELEMVEKKYRIEDALNATRAAAEMGIVPGGGTALHRVSMSLRSHDVPANERAGYDVVTEACLAPMRKIVENAGASFDVVSMLLSQEPGKGYDANTGKVVDLVSSGIIDPLKVTRTALENAVSVAVTFLTLDAAIHTA